MFLSLQLTLSASRAQSGRVHFPSPFDVNVINLDWIQSTEPARQAGNFKERPLRLFLSIAFSFLVSCNVFAAETPWVQHSDMLSSRIVVASSDMTTSEGTLFAWEAKLQPGWKTYWRSPGEAGLPVRVFQGTDELTPLYPLPERFELFGIQTFGYGKQLMLPFRANAEGADNVDFKVDFMVCKEICVPFEQTYSLEDIQGAQETSFHDIRFETWLDKVPDTHAALHGMKIDAVKLTGPVGHQKLIVDVSGDCEMDLADVFVESDHMVHFGLPKKRLLGNGKQARLILSAMSSGKAKDLAGAVLRLTFTDGHGIAIDRTLTLR